MLAAIHAILLPFILNLVKMSYFADAYADMIMADGITLLCSDILVTITLIEVWILCICSTANF